jgi:hypothetical protein
MPDSKYSGARSDGRQIGKDIRELVRLMIEEDYTWQNAADTVGIKRTRAYRALRKVHIVAFQRESRRQYIEMLSTRIPRKLNSLMDSENHAAAVRAAVALEGLNVESQQLRHINVAAGIVVVIGRGQQALPIDARPAPLELKAVVEERK